MAERQRNVRFIGHEDVACSGTEQHSCAVDHDVFIVHAEDDTPIVRGELLPMLNLAGDRVILSSELPFPAFTEQAIEDSVRRSRLTVAVISPAYLRDRWAGFAELLSRNVDHRGGRVVPLIIADCDVPAVLAQYATLDGRTPRQRETAAVRLRERLGRPEPEAAPVTCPYPGMRPFSAAMAARFYGREREIESVLGRLHAGEREIYVVGPSGSGKSSLIAAGVLPRVQDDAGGERFAVRSLRPGERPAQRLAEVVGCDQESLRGALGWLLDREHRERLLVFVDQLEELFTLADAEERDRFVRALRVLRADRRCHLIVALRADFYGALMSSELWPDIEDRFTRFEVAPLRGEALRRAIEAPAFETGVYLERGLVERLISDAAAEPGALPLLQETLVLLWARRSHRLLRLASYEALDTDPPAQHAGAPEPETRTSRDACLRESRSGIAIALARRADAALHDLKPAEQRVARRIFLRLVNFGEGRPDTRRQQPRAALAACGAAHADADPVIDHLTDARLLTSDATLGGEPLVDLAHEALITSWPKLQHWLRSHRDDEQRRRLLELHAAQWVRRGRGSVGLFDAIELAEAKRWIAECTARELDYSDDPRQLAETRWLDHPGLALREAEFLAASRSAILRRRIFSAGGAAVLVIGGVLAGLAIRARARREVEAVVADHVRTAIAAQEIARQIAVRRDVARDRVFELFDTSRWDEGEDAWTEVEALAAREEREYRVASGRLESAMLLDPARGGLRERFADLTSERLLRAERDLRRDLADELATRLAAYDDGGRRAALGTEARVDLEVAPAGANVWSERPGGPRQFVGQAPLTALVMPPGSMVMSFEAPGRVTARLPILLPRGQTLSVRVALPPADSAPPGMIYVPPGRFLAGSADPSDMRRFLSAAPLHEIQTAGFFIGRYEVTFAEWIEFLDDLPPDERRRRSPSTVGMEAALSLTEIGPRQWQLVLTPRTRTYTAETGQRLHYEGRTKRADQDWTRFPVSAVSYDDAVAYAAWLDRTGRLAGARLCDEYEWERAARGADARTFPGGPALAPDDANIDVTYGRDPVAFGPDEVGSHPASRSPVGADDMAGNVWEMTRSVQTPGAPMIRGGAWYYGVITARSANRQYGEPTMRDVLVGLRLCATPR